MPGQVSQKGKNRPRPVYHCDCGDHAWTSPQRAGVILVSPEDAGVIAHRAWVLSREGYVGGLGEPSLARLIAGKPHGLKVDHVNHDKQDNRRSNLRTVNDQQSVWNRRKMPTRAAKASRYKGVNWQKTGWIARIGIGRERVYLGRFASEDDAALAYDQAAKRLHGEFAVLNLRES